MTKRRNTTNLNIILLYILIGFGLFDCVRLYTLLPVWVGYIKDVAIILIITLNFRKIKIYKSDKSLLLWFIVVLFGTPLGFLHCEMNQYKIVYACLQYIEVFLLYFIFNNSEYIFKKNIMDIIDIYIRGALLLCIINIFGTSIDNPIINNKYAYFNEFDTMYVGRLTVGQPGVAILPIVFSTIFYMCFKKNVKNNTILILFITAVVLSTANTAIVAMAVVFLIYSIYGLKKGDKGIFRKWMLLAIGIVGILLFLNLNSNLDMVEKIIAMYGNKIGAYFHGGSDFSMNIRTEKKNIVFNSMGICDFITGLGAYGFVNSKALSGMTTMENTYVTNIVQYGLVGTTTFFIFIFSRIKGLCKYIYIDKYFLFMSLEFVSLLIIMLTLDLYNIYMLYFMASLIFTISSKKNIASSKYWGEIR